jgi:hypothetical protein
VDDPLAAAVALELARAGSGLPAGVLEHDRDGRLHDRGVRARWRWNPAGGLELLIGTGVGGAAWRRIAPDGAVRAMAAPPGPEAGDAAWRAYGEALRTSELVLVDPQDPEPPPHDPARQLATRLDGEAWVLHER